MEKAAGVRKSTVKTRRQILTKELTALVKLLDEKGIEFLKHQAEVLLHNSRVESVRRRAASAREADPTAAGSPEHPSPSRDVMVEGIDHRLFNITVGRSRTFFTKEEIKILTKICHAASGLPDATTRLYRWFERERKDFLNEVEIMRAGDPVLAEIYDIILNTREVRDR
jgi:hypothetical protein